VEQIGLERAETSEKQRAVEEMAKAMSEQRVREVTGKYEERLRQKDHDLENRVGKVLQLEMELDEVKDAYRSLESNLSREDQQYKQQA
jgi:hypothetical protein